MDGVTVVPATAVDQPKIANMLQLYIYDFTEMWAGEERGELEEDGSFGAYEPLGSYWREDGREPLLIRVGGRLAGFALLNQETRTGRAADWDMAEFFIVRKHRRSGAGMAAAHAIFESHPGQWELAIARGNLGAQKFWPRTVASAPGVRAIETLDKAHGAWNGPILRFRIG